MFKSIREISDVRGTELLEIQICSLNKETKLSEILDYTSINNRHILSLYIFYDDYDMFYELYAAYFKNAIHPNLRFGVLDPHSINYFNLEQTNEILKKISDEKPNHYEKLIEFLSTANKENDFYILGF